MRRTGIIMIVLLMSAYIFISVCVVHAGEMPNNNLLQHNIEQCGLSTNYTTRELLDLAGNKYILVECKGGGYGIYHPTAQVFVEFSAKQPQKQKSVNL